MSSSSAFIQDDNPSTSSQEKDSKKIDIFQHLRINLKTSKTTCSCDNINSLYCIPCKISVCSKCNYSEHQNHILISKKDYHFNPENIDSIYDSIQCTLSADKMFVDHKPTQKELVNQIEKMAQVLHKKIDMIKDMKIKEITKMFDGFASNVNQLKQRIEKGRTDLKGFYNKNNKFFNTSPPQDNANTNHKGNNKQNKNTILNDDPTNSLFLMNYELLNISQSKRKEILANMKKIHKCLDNFKLNQNEYIDSIQNSVESILFGEYHAHNNSTEELESILDETAPSYPFKCAIGTLNENNFNEITARINQYNVLFEQFKKSVYDSITKYGNLKEIGKYISSFEATKSTEADTQLFSHKSSKDKIVPRQNKSELALLKMNYHNKDEIILNNELLMKYFACLALENYEKNFKQDVKELQSSHADLMIRRNEDEDESQKDFAKAIENTNLILLYYRKERQMVRQLVDLKLNPFGYKKFPNGCRSILIGDKVYITGGKDEVKTYNNVLIYDRRTNVLKRIIDLIEPRAYHSLVFCDVFETLMVIGGENCSSCEIFDPLINRWALLPSLNVPRANILFQFDKPRGIMYAMFGNEGTILEEKYSSEIEYLDLQDMKSGWIVMDYENKAELNLKTYLSVVEINNDLFLIHGGYVAKKPKRAVSVLDKERKIMLKCDRKMMEKIREEAKASKRINAIVSSLHSS